MATTEEFTAIVRALNRVSTAGGARSAIGAALQAISPAYELAKRLPSDRARAGKGELDSARQALEAWYGQIKTVSSAAPFQSEWSTKRRLIERAYIVIGGIEAEAGHRPSTSNLAILEQSIVEAPAVLTKAVGKAAANVSKEAGKVVGGAAGGILSGLGLSGTVSVLLIVAVVVVALKRGSILGRIFG